MSYENVDPKERILNKIIELLLKHKDTSKLTIREIAKELKLILS